MDDFRLIKNYLDGDGAALEELVAKYQKCIFRLALSITGDMEESKDITQSTFLNAVKNLQNFRKKSSFKTWLYRIAINLCHDFNGKHRYKEEDLKETIVSNQSGALKFLIMKETRSHVWDALMGVPERQRISILLRTREGLSCREVAEILNISAGAVKANYHNGLKRLREILRERGYETAS